MGGELADLHILLTLLGTEIARFLYERMLAKVLGEVFNNLSPAIPTDEEAAFLVGEF